MDKTASSTPDEFASALAQSAPLFGVRLKAHDVSGLRAYYEQVMAWNTLLHLVAPCSPAEFAKRHVLESLLALEHLPGGARIADIGSGAGLPIIPCLIVRPDLSATLIEASQKKAIFLREALREAGAQNRTEVIAARFEETPAPACGFVTCRALERFVEMFPTILEWSPQASTLLFFGGESLREQIEKRDLIYRAVRIPESERRFIFIIERR